MSRQILERIRDFARENYPIQMNDLIAEINIELAKPEPQPDYWHVMGPDGESIFSASWKEACHEYIIDSIDFGSDEAASWVVRPLWAKPIN